MQSVYFCFLLIIVAFLSTVFLTKRLIPRLSEIAKQPIYDEGPRWHISKSGTPTMGGLGFIVPFAILCAICIILYLANENHIGLSLAISLAFCLTNGLIGFVDDLTKLKRGKNGGLTPKQKLILQSFTAVLFLIARYVLFNDGTEVKFGKFEIDFGIFYFPFAMLFLLGIVNCANLTDGVDGLASSVALAISVFTFLASISFSVESQLIASITIGVILGFLVFNIHPAKIFMGDTGSLFLGAIAATYAFTLKSLPAFIIICGVYVIEGSSVIMQVIAYKSTGKRIFKMAPIHHHLEKIGFDESTICLWAMILTFALSLFGYALIGGK